MRLGDMHYLYDKAGNRTKMTYPPGKAVTRAFDALNRISAISDGNS